MGRCAYLQKILVLFFLERNTLFIYVYKCLFYRLFLRPEPNMNPVVTSKHTIHRFKIKNGTEELKIYWDIYIHVLVYRPKKFFSF